MPLDLHTETSRSSSRFSFDCLEGGKAGEDGRIARTPNIVDRDALNDPNLTLSDQFDVVAVFMRKWREGSLEGTCCASTIASR